MKKYIYPLIIVLSLVIAATSLYSFASANNELKETRKEKSLLVKDLDSLKIKDENKQKDLDNLKKELDQTKKDLEKATKKLKETNNDNILQPQEESNNAAFNSSVQKAVGATEYKVPSEEDQKKMAEMYEKELADKEAKENEPQYAVHEAGSILRFKVDYGLTDEMFDQLNPGAEIKIGNTYRIK